MRGTKNMEIYIFRVINTLTVQSKHTMENSRASLKNCDNLSRYKTLLNTQHACDWLKLSFLCEITWWG